MRPGRPARLLRLVAVVVGARGQAPVPNFLVEVRSGRDAAAAVATVASAVVSAAAGGGGRGLEFTIAAAEPFDELGRFAGAMRLARQLLDDERERCELRRAKRRQIGCPCRCRRA